MQNNFIYSKFDYFFFINYGYYFIILIFCNQNYQIRFDI